MDCFVLQDRNFALKIKNPLSYAVILFSMEINFENHGDF